MPSSYKIIHIITDLATGGAEMMLYKLVSAMHSSEFSSQVISLTGEGPLADCIRDLGIPLTALGMRPGRFSISPILRLTKLLRQHQPNVVQTWMYHSDFLGGLASRLAGSPILVWNIRNSTLDVQRSKRTTRWTVQACARLSHHWPSRIISCSKTAGEVHVGLGYEADKMLVIPNGFDLSRFQPYKSARQLLRDELGLSTDTVLIGSVGRFDPQKDYLNLIHAAKKLQVERPDVHFVLCGEGLTNENPYLTGWINDTGLRSVFHLLGRRTDIPNVMAAFDLATSSSAYGEAFSNVIGEAMACGVPFVATDVGDAAGILGYTGRVVPPRDSAALAAAWLELLDLPDEERAALGAAARRRIEDNFSLSAVAGQYVSLYRELAAAEGH